MTEPLTPAAGSRIMPFNDAVRDPLTGKDCAPRALSQSTLDYCHAVMARDAARDAEAQLTDPERIGTGVML